jgi:signal transduction histidine kinase
MHRANTAVAVVLLAVLVLALVAVLAGLRASRNQERAEQAEQAGRERLWKAYLAQARAERISGVPGCREVALGVINNAAKLRSSPALRTEAVACLALTDMSQEGALLRTPRDLVSRDLDVNLRHYAYGDAKGNVWVGDFATREAPVSLQAGEVGPGTSLAVRNVCFSPDGSLVAARFAGGAAVVWNAATKQMLMAANTSSTNVPAFDLSFSPDSKQVIFHDAQAQAQIVVYEAATGRKLSSGIEAGLSSFRLRPDGKQVAIVVAEGVALLDYPSGTNTQTLPHLGSVSFLNWSPDGTRLATSCYDGDVYIWDLPQATRRILRGHSERAVSLGFSPDGTKFFSSSRDGTTRLWDLTAGQTIAIGEGAAFGFAPDGQRLGFFQQLTGFGVWRISQSTDYRLLPCDRSEGPLRSVDLSLSGRWCVATQEKGFRLWDLSAGEREYYFPVSSLWCARIAADEQSLLLCRDTGLEVWPLTNQVAGELHLPPADSRRIPLPDDRGARAVAVSLDGRWAAVHLTDQRLVALDLVGEHAPVVLKDQCRGVGRGPASPTGAGRFAISPDGRWIVTGFNFGEDDVPRVWDTRSGEVATKFEAETSLAAFSPDGRWLGLAGMDRYSIWSVGDWQRHGGFERPDPSLLHGTLAFSREGGLLALASTRRTVQLRTMLPEQVLFDLIGPTPQSVNNIRLALDGSVLVTATASDAVEVWRLDRLRHELAALNLDWTAPQPGEVSSAGAFVAGRATPRATLALSLAGCVLAALFAVVTLRQQRASIRRFLKAEANAAQHSRELEMARVELMHSQKMQALGTLSAGIAHDFNNLLSVIRMSNKLIGRTSRGNTEIQECVSDIEQAAVQGKSVIHSMLGYARDESAGAEPPSVNEVVETTLSLLSKEFLSGIQLTLELVPEAQTVAMHQGRLEQILLNLVINAAEAMQGRGRLKICTLLRSGVLDGLQVLRPQPAARYVELTVSDSGPGIEREIIGRIFDPFFSTKRSSSTLGTGLGLSLVYSIAERAGFGLNVQSVPGSGATFFVWIPVTSA